MYKASLLLLLYWIKRHKAFAPLLQDQRKKYLYGFSLIVAESVFCAVTPLISPFDTLKMSKKQLYKTAKCELRVNI